jgi:hypothetical protein
MGRRPIKKTKNYKQFPKGETKLDILTYLLDREKSRGEILTHLKKIKKIEVNRGIDKHITELTNKKYIIKRETGKGNPVYYSICSDYNIFKKIFNNFLKYDRELELLNSDYFKNLINEEIIQKVSEDLIKCLFTMFSKLFFMTEEEMEEDEQLSIMIKEIKQDNKLYNNFVNRMKIMKEYLISNGSIKSEVIEDKNGEFEEYDSIEDEETNKLEEVWLDTDNPFVNILTTILIPHHEREEMIQILKTSPTALKFVISFDNYNLKESYPLIVAYFQYYYQHLINIGQKLEPKKDKADLRDFIEAGLIELNTLNRSSQTPLLSILKAFLITDIFQNRIVKNKWLGYYYKSLFIDDPDLLDHLTKLRDEELKNNDEKKNN